MRDITCRRISWLICRAYKPRETKNSIKQTRNEFNMNLVPKKVRPRTVPFMVIASRGYIFVPTDPLNEKSLDNSFLVVLNRQCDENSKRRGRNIARRY